MELIQLTKGNDEEEKKHFTLTGLNYQQHESTRAAELTHLKPIIDTYISKMTWPFSLFHRELSLAFNSIVNWKIVCKYNGSIFNELQMSCGPIVNVGLQCTLA